MTTEILLIWLALSLAFAAGWAIRARMPILLLTLIPCVLLAACLPRIETVMVQQCELAPPTYTSPVMWRYGAWCIYHENRRDYRTGERDLVGFGYWTEESLKRVTVIGNIYEHPKPQKERLVSEARK